VEALKGHDALYETSKYLLYHNPPRPDVPER